jgi:pyruvate/2-oxoglutarate/acetoin dehydrogenase E1 component
LPGEDSSSPGQDINIEIRKDLGGFLMRELYFVEAINEAMIEEMRRDPTVFILGEDIRFGHGGGIFGATKGMLEEFGEERVIDTPLSELAISGSAAGAAYMGMRPIAEIMFADFMAICHDLIVNGASKFRWASDGKAGCPVVYRAAFGAGVGATLHHSQSPEGWLMNAPGLTIVMPSTPYDAKGLLKSAIRCDDPVVFLEHKLLYRRLQQDVPETEYLIPLGKADIKREGADATIIATGAMVQQALEAAQILEDQEGLSVEVLDPRTLLPLDEDTILESVRKTGRVVIVHEAPVTGGFGAEVSAVIAEKAIEYLDAPILRVGAPWCSVPANRNLERNHYLPTAEKITRAVEKVVRFGGEG